MASKLLIAAGETAAAPEQVPASVRALIDVADEIMVVAPALPSRWEWLSSATDKASDHADERLQAVLGHLGELGADASGQVGADDPLVAIEDAVRSFDPDHILVGLRAGERAGWQERGLLDAVLDSFGLPLTVFQFRDG